jgi:hypothetical protein
VGTSAGVTRNGLRPYDSAAISAAVRGRVGVALAGVGPGTGATVRSRSALARAALGLVQSLLRRAQVGHGGGQRGQGHGQGRELRGRLPGSRGQQRDHPGGGAQRGAGVGARRDAPVALPAGPVERLRGVGQRAAALALHPGRGGRQGVAGGPGRVGGTVRVAAGVGGDPVGGLGDDALGLAPHPLGLVGAQRTVAARRCRIRPGGAAGGCCRSGAGGFPAGAQLGQRQVRGELAAAEAHRLPRAVGPAVQRHRVAGHLARVALAQPRPHAHPVAGQRGSELGEPAAARGRGLDPLPQHVPGQLAAAGPLGGDRLLDPRAAGGGVVVPAGGGAQPEPGLEGVRHLGQRYRPGGARRVAQVREARRGGGTRPRRPAPGRWAVRTSESCRGKRDQGAARKRLAGALIARVRAAATGGRA